ncbi:MAG TPA: hypothetical protein VFY41_09010 [Nitrososphaeraceae archaeon]|nr:hypothetical protein [Nitrososphaeraceae archaeon]
MTPRSYNSNNKPNGESTHRVAVVTRKSSKYEKVRNGMLIDFATN